MSLENKIPFQILQKRVRKRRHDIQHDCILYNDSEDKDTQHGGRHDIQYNDT